MVALMGVRQWEMSRLNAELSEEAHEVWRKLARDNDLPNVTVMLEVLALCQEQGLAKLLDAATVSLARDIAEERRDRSHLGGG